jgi:hypothetical protein
MNPIELTVIPHPHNGSSHYMVCWPDDESGLTRIPEIYLNLAPFMVARFLPSRGYNPQRLLIVRLQGADYELLRAPLASAMPVVNATPASQATRSIFHKSQHGS